MPATCIDRGADRPLPIGSTVRLADGGTGTVALYAPTTDGGWA
jgi:hypothetical protein